MPDLVSSFLKDDPTFNVQLQLKEMVDNQQEVHNKIVLLRLLYKRINEETIQMEWKNWIANHFEQLDSQAMYDFIFNGWAKPSKEDSKKFMNNIVETASKARKGVYHYPDPVESKLECVYILYISGIISDIKPLEILASDKPLLQFLLSPPQFDYTSVDFSNYMWVNFAHHKEYMAYFIEHKMSIIPQLRERVTKGLASDDEVKILYGYLLTGDEIFNSEV